MVNQIEHQQLINEFAAANLELNLAKVENEKLKVRLDAATEILTGVRGMFLVGVGNPEGEMWRGRINGFLKDAQQS